MFSKTKYSLCSNNRKNIFQFWIRWRINEFTIFAKLFSRAEFEDLIAEDKEPWWMHETCMEKQDLTAYYGEEEEEEEEPQRQFAQDDGQDEFAWA